MFKKFFKKYFYTLLKLFSLATPMEIMQIFNNSSKTYLKNKYFHNFLNYFHSQHQITEVYCYHSLYSYSVCKLCKILLFYSKNNYFHTF